MRTQPQTPELLFSRDGSVLLHCLAGQRKVIGWNFETLTQRYVCDGRLIGVSESGRLIVTETEPDRFRFWQCESGEEAEPESIDKSDFPFDVRFRVRLQRNKNRSYDGQWIDITGTDPVVPFVIRPSGTTQVEVIDNWTVVSSDGRLALAWAWAEEDFDGAFGAFHERTGGRLSGVTLTVSRFHSVPPMYHYREHDFLITGLQTGFCVYLASTGKPVGRFQGEYSFLDGGGSLVVPHPQNRFWLAVNRKPVLSKHMDRQGFALVDISSGNQKPQEIRSFPESKPVRGLAFHPNGQSIADVLDDETVHLWDVESGNLQMKNPQAKVTLV